MDLAANKTKYRCHDTRRAIKNNPKVKLLIEVVLNPLNKACNNKIKGSVSISVKCQ